MAVSIKSQSGLLEKWQGWCVSSARCHYEAKSGATNCVAGCQSRLVEFSSPGSARVCFHLLIFDIARFITKGTWLCANPAKSSRKNCTEFL